MNPSDKAEVACLRVILRALEKGTAVSKPVVEGTRYDLVLDHEGRLYRAQVKYCDGVCRAGAIWVRLHSGSYGKVRFRCYSAQEVDVVLAYVPKLDAILWIDPCDFEGKGAMTFRVEKALNNQTKGCRAFQDYVW